MSCQEENQSILISTDRDEICGVNSFDIYAKAGLFCISAASIAFEINLTRLFSIAQFYHFAFMIVSTALLGSAASGILLMIFPKLSRISSKIFLPWASVCAGISMIGAYSFFNHVPFDSFSVSWDIRQVWLLICDYLLLSMPFLFCGIAVSWLLNNCAEKSGRVYAVNLTGSALGCFFALALPGMIGGDGIVLFCSGFTSIGALLFCMNDPRRKMSAKISGWKYARHRLPFLTAILLILFSAIDLGFRFSGSSLYPWMSLNISPYKGLSNVMQFPDTKMLAEKWNAFSRINLVESSAIRSLPGLSYRYQLQLPIEHGLFIDGDDMSPVLISIENREFSDYLPHALAFKLRPGANTLILEPRGGLDIWTALLQGSSHITAVEQNPLIVPLAGKAYANEQVRTIVEFERSYLKRSRDKYDVIVISLASGYHPIQSGAYSLAEDYRYTVEAMVDSIDHLNGEGILFFMRWLQYPPSEDLRAFALAVEALERIGGEPQTQIVAFRGYNTSTIMIKRTPFTPAEMTMIRSFLDENAFDLSYSPDVQPEETNRYNILPESVYYQTYSRLIETEDRRSYYSEYPYDISPPTDDHPFMGHYFKWGQTGQIMAEWGKTWQPFGGAGYLAIVGLLLITVVIGSGLVILPWVFTKRWRTESEYSAMPRRANWRHFTYFACIGFGYLLVEIPLIQKFILFLEQPAYAFTIILLAILFFSGCGSYLAHKLSLKKCLLGVVVLILFLPLLMSLVVEMTFGLSLGWRMGITIMLVAPMGFLMGIPFPAGLRWILEKNYSVYIPWFWGINGAASVISSILAAMLALSFGFSWVLRMGAGMYLLGWLMVSWADHLALTVLHR